MVLTGWAKASMVAYLECVLFEPEFQYVWADEEDRVDETPFGVQVPAVCVTRSV